MEKVRQINRGCIREKGMIECWQPIRYVLGWATSEESREGVKHDLVYELLGRVLQLSFGPFLVFREDV